MQTSDNARAAMAIKETFTRYDTQARFRTILERHLAFERWETEMEIEFAFPFSPAEGLAPRLAHLYENSESLASRAR